MTSIKIALGQSNTAGLKKFEELSPPLFFDFIGKENILTEWHDVVSQELDGNRDFVDIGLPHVTWALFRVSRAEFSYIKTYFFGAVTIYTLDQGGNSYHAYNGKMKPIRSGQDVGTWAADGIGGWQDMKIEIYDLELIS